MDRSVVFPRFLCAALSPSHGPRPLLRANLRLAADGFSMGATRSIYLGFPAPVRDLRSGEDCIQHFVSPRAAGAAFDGAGKLYGGRPREGFHRNTHSPPFF